MTSKLTDEELAMVLDEAMVSLDDVAKERVECLVSELRSLRAAPVISEAEREALEFALAVVKHSINGVRERFGKKAIINPLATRALAAIERLLAVGGAR